MITNWKNIENKFEKQRAGIVFIENRLARVVSAYHLISLFANNWDYIVWLAPHALLHMKRYVNMVRETFRKYAKKILFFSQETISGSDWQYLKLYNLSSSYRIFCVVDDCINIKNASSLLNKRLQTMRQKFAYRLLLSDNPLTKSLKDLYVQMQFIEPAVFNMTERQFFHNFMIKDLADHDKYKSYSFSEAEQKVLALACSYILIVDLVNTKQIEQIEYRFELTDKEQKFYQQDKEQLLQKLFVGGYLSISQHFQYYYTLCQKKVETLRKLLLQISRRNEKVIIYVKFSSEIIFLEETGVLEGYSYVIMTGKTNKNRASMLFDVDYNVMICTYKVKIPRLYLQDCTNLIYFSQTFDYKDKMDILSKLSNSELRIYNFWVNTGLEKMIEDNLVRKQKLWKDVCEMMNDKVALYEGLS